MPIIHALQSCYWGDIVNGSMGICNGMTNYMLKKIEEGQDFDKILEEAHTWTPLVIFRRSDH